MNHELRITSYCTPTSIFIYHVAPLHLLHSKKSINQSIRSPAIRSRTSVLYMRAWGIGDEMSQLFKGICLVRSKAVIRCARLERECFKCFGGATK